MTDTSALVLATQNWSTGDKLFYVVGCLLLAALIAVLFSHKKQ